MLNKRLPLSFFSDPEPSWLDWALALARDIRTKGAPASHRLHNKTSLVEARSLLFKAAEPFTPEKQLRREPGLDAVPCHVQSPREREPEGLAPGSGEQGSPKNGVLSLQDTHLFGSPMGTA